MTVDQTQIRSAREKQALSGLVAARVKLRRRGKEWLGLCPFHNERTPSFTVRDDKGFYHCFGCGAHGDAIQWVMAWEHLPFAQAVEALNGGKPLNPAELKKIEDDRRIQERDHRRTFRELARELWFEARPIAGTPAERYLRGRGILGPLPATLRYGARVLRGPKHPDGPGSAGTYLPALVAAVQDAAGRVIAAHRIFLNPETIDAPRPLRLAGEEAKQLLGVPVDGAVRLSSAQGASTLAICEGVETGLAVLEELPELALWAAIYASRLPAVRLPAGVREVLILADRDPISVKPGHMQGKRPGEYWARRAAEAYTRAGRTVRIAVPPGEKADFNDLLLQRGEIPPEARRPGPSQEGAR